VDARPGRDFDDRLARGVRRGRSGKHGGCDNKQRSSEPDGQAQTVVKGGFNRR
jgi:hypothetical protein